MLGNLEHEGIHFQVELCDLVVKITEKDEADIEVKASRQVYEQARQGHGELWKV